MAPKQPSNTSLDPPKKSNFIVRTLLTRPRFIISLLLAIIIFSICYPTQGSLMSLILAWNAFSWVYLIFIFQKIIKNSNKDIRALTKNEDESARMVMFFLLAGCIVSLLVLFFALGDHGALTNRDHYIRYALTASTLISSWLLLPTGFTMHYAHLYYSNPPHLGPWLIFPDKITNPGYWDFMYFSFTIAVASQTADVDVGSTPMRRAVLLQSVVSFVFNMAILGLCINILAGLF